jgi:hypothetical protein
LDLRSHRFEPDASPVALPGDLGLLMVGAAARQAASPTAAAQACLRPSVREPQLFAPVHGAFNGRTAHAIIDWKGE